MTIVEKAAYLKGLAEGLDIENSSKEAKLWGTLIDLVSDMAHEIENLQQSDDDFADSLDELCDEVAYLEEMGEIFEDDDDSCDEDGNFRTCKGCPKDYKDFNPDEYDDETDSVFRIVGSSDDPDETEDPDAEADEDADAGDGAEESDTAEDDSDVPYDGIVYDVVCPKCGEQISFDEETLDKGSIRCPGCGEILEFDLDDLI